MPVYSAVATLAGDAMMPEWLYRLVRRLPIVRRSEERMARTQHEITLAREERAASQKVRALVHSYTRAGRRLGDVRGGR